MQPDGITISLVTRELENLLAGARVERVLQPTDDTIILVLRKQHQSFYLLASARADFARLHLTRRPAAENPSRPPLFCLVLRKHLEGGRLLKIAQKDLDRVVFLTFGRPWEDEGGEKVLAVEVMGKHSNIILLEGRTQTIIDGIKKYSHALSRYREVLPGRPYIPPPEQEKADPRRLDEEGFRAALMRGPWEQPVASLLVRHIAGVGSLLAREVLARAGLPLDLALEFCGDFELRALWRAFRELVFQLLAGSYKPVVVREEGQPVCFAPFPPLLYQGLPLEEAETLNAALDRYYAAREEAQKFHQLASALKSTVSRELERCTRRMEAATRARAEAEKAQVFRIQGETLLAYLHEVEPGREVVFLPNVYDPSGEPLAIPLDPSLSPSQNAQQLFRRYQKARATLVAAEKQLKQIEEEQEYLRGVAASLAQAESLRELEEIRSELEEAGYLKPREKKEKGKKGTQAPQVLRFTSAEGFEILVGKNNLQNDYLTMRLARENDLWLHVKEGPGAHVVIKAQPGKGIPPATLLAAAKLAAYYSEARHSSKVAVAYTRRKNVTKPPKARPGFVLYTNYETLLVTPEPPGQACSPASQEEPRRGRGDTPPGDRW